MPHKLLQELLHAVKSIREMPMQRAVMAERLGRASAEETVLVLRELVTRGGRGNLDVSLALSALVSTLEHPDVLPYETRAALYSAAVNLKIPEISYILLEGQNADHETEDTPRVLLPNGPAMTLGARKSAARTRDPELLALLIHDPNIQVVAMVLDNPNLKESEALVMASRRPNRADTLQRLATHPRWSRARRIRLAIALNPASPLPLACRMCLDLRDTDLGELAGDASSAALLRAHAQRLIERRNARD